MLSTRILDSSSNCSIIKHSLLDDLLSYQINNDNIKFSNNRTSSINPKIEDLDSLISENYPENLPIGVWCPIFIDNDDFVTNKILSSEGSYLNGNAALSSGRLGIENFYSFTPQFKTLSTPPDADMVIDWIINKPNIPYAPYYGVMCWVKVLDDNSIRHPGGATAPLDSFPIGSRLKHSSRPSDVLIKLSEEKLQVVGQDTSIFTSNQVAFGAEEGVSIVSVSSLGSDVFNLATLYNEESTTTNQSQSQNTDSISINGKKVHLWVPNGDMFCYYTSDVDKARLEELGIPSNSYISPALYKSYEHIYRILTLDEPRVLSKSVSKSRCYKKLAHLLSTSPFISDFSINALDYIHIRELVKQYISNQEENTTTIEDEKILLKDSILDISKVLQKTIIRNSQTQNNSLYLDTKPNHFSFNQNYITNYDQLFSKLIHKYGATLQIKSDASIRLKSSVPIDNTGLGITQITTNLCSKTLTNTTVYNNQTIEFDRSVIETSMSNEDTGIKLKFDNELLKTIPLYDMAKPEFPGPSINNEAEAEIDPNSGTKFLPSLVKLGSIPPALMSNNAEYSPQAEMQDYIYKTYIPNNTENLSGITEMLRMGIDRDHGVKAEIELKGLDYMPKERITETFYISEKYLDPLITYKWTQVSGPPAGFKDEKDDKKILRVSTSEFPVLKTSYTGKFVIRCQINSPFGSYTKDRTIYVIDGAELRERWITQDLGGGRNRRVLGGYDANPNVGNYWDPDTLTWTTPPIIDTDTPEFKPVLLNTDNLRAHLCKFNKLAISNIGGVFWPINTEFKVKEDIGTLGNGVPQEEVFNLSASYKFTIGQNSNITSNNINFRIFYKPNNTVIKIHSILIEKIRSKQPNCEQCLSFYEPKLAGYRASIITGGSSAISGPLNKVNGIRYIRTNQFPEAFSLYKYTWNQQNGAIDINTEKVQFDFPKISTDFAPKMKTYGGYHPSFLSVMGISSITGLQPPRDTRVPFSGQLISTSPSFLPDITGYKMDHKNSRDPNTYKMCYQKALPATTGGGILNFTKGIFHPSSGWIPHSGEGYQLHANRSSVLKFNPAARESFSFVGPSLKALSCSDIDFDNNKVKLAAFSSSISLSIAKDVQWDPACYCSEEPPGGAGYNNELYNKNQKNKEYADIDPNISNHGYRYLAGGKPKTFELTTNNKEMENDEFFTSQESGVFSYAFAVTGPVSLPENREQDDGRLQLRIPTVENFRLKNIEVKLNFLNYVNTKNIIVKLAVEVPPTKEANQLEAADPDPVRRLPPSPLRLGENTFIDQTVPPKTTFGRYRNNPLISEGINNSGIASYLQSLMRLNCGSGIGQPSDNPGPDNEIVLLNQEFIQNNRYNFSIKFSDDAPKYNVLYDHNILPAPTGTGTLASSTLAFMSGIGQSYIDSAYQTNQFCKNQNIISSNDSILPTCAAYGYSDREACFYTSVIRHNKLNINNNSLSKLFSSNMFRSPSPEFGPCPPERQPKQRAGDLGAATKFTLTVIVLDEEDDMSPHDTVQNNQYLTNLKQTENIQSSADIFNSLCNWELILHVGAVEKPIPYSNPHLGSYGNCDNLSLIEYGKDPKYPGNSYIADLSKYKTLLPLANVDAPNSFIADASVCQVDPASDSFGSIMMRPAEFPIYAILSIMMTLTLTTYAFTGGLASGLAALGAMSALLGPAYKAITDFFQESAFMQELANAGRQLYAPSYTKYPFGSPEKILLNIRKPGGLWHSLEASIFKYINSPILKPNRYNFIRVHRGCGENISEFKMIPVGSVEELIDNSFIKTLSIECSRSEEIEELLFDAPKVINNQIYNEGDLVRINFIADPQQRDNEECLARAALYIPMKNTAWIKVKDKPRNTTPAQWRTQNNYQDLNQSLHFMSHNAIIGFNQSLFSNTLYGDMQDNKVVVCEGRVPYDIFSVRDTVECYDYSDRLSVINNNDNNNNNNNNNNNTSIVNRIISKKGLIFKNNKLYSVLVFDQSVANQNTVSPLLSSNTFFIYKPQTSIDKEVSQPYSIWSLDKTVYHKPTDNQITAHSTGSLGDLSPYVSKNNLYNKLQFNKLENIYEFVNNKTNDKIKNHKLKIFTYDTGNYDLIANTGFSNTSLHGFPYSATELNSTVFDTSNRFVVVEPENIRQGNSDAYELTQKLSKQIRLSSANNESSNEYMYIKAIGADSASLSGLYGQLEIENDYVEHIPIEKLELSYSNRGVGLRDVIDRVLKLDNQQLNNVLESKVGNESETATIIASSNIYYIAKHLNKLKIDDPGDCHTPNPSDPNKCYKDRLNKELQKLYIERNELIKVLELQTVAEADVSYVNEVGVPKSASGEIFAETDTLIVIKPRSNNSSEEQSSSAPVIKIKKDKNTFITRKFVSIFDLPDTHIRKANADILPKLKINIARGSGGSLNVSYLPVNNDHYWINIDPSQGCIVDFASNPKILVSTEYECSEANPIAGYQVFMDDNVCTNFASKDNIQDGGVENYGKEPFKHKYSIPNSKIDRDKIHYEQIFSGSISGWKQYTKERWFNINGDSVVGTLPNQELTVKSTETYLIPIPNTPTASPTWDEGFGSLNTSSDLSADVGEAPGELPCQTNHGSPVGKGLLDSYGERLRDRGPIRVTNVLNLTDVNDIEVMVKRIPRLLRGVDLLATIFRYGAQSLFRATSSANPRIPLELDTVGLGGAINNSLYCWVCLQKASNGTLEYTELPDFFKWQNEMIFRSFYGSVDKIENKIDSLVTQFPWELIPYEYGTKSE